MVTLLRNGANIDHMDYGRQTAVDWAAYRGREGAMRVLLQHNPAPAYLRTTASAAKDDSPLHSAARKSFAGVVDLLLAAGVNPNVVNYANHRSALHLAAKSGSLHIARSLLDAGAAVNARDKSGYMPLHLAARYNHLHIMKLLMERGATVEPDPLGCYRSVLHCAVENCRLPAIQMLMRAGAHMDGADACTLTGFTPLHLAVYEGYADAVSALVRGSRTRAARGRPATFHVNAVTDNPKRETALHMAARAGAYDMVSTLMKARPDVTIVDNDGFTAQQVARNEGYFDLADAMDQWHAQHANWDRRDAFCTFAAIVAAAPPPPPPPSAAAAAAARKRARK
jgi:ankyrin repeat protein